VAPSRGADEPLTDRQVENLTALAHALGPIRYFHASDGVFDSRWPELTVVAVGEVIAARDPAELRAALERVFLPVAPTVQFFSAADPAPAPIFVRAEQGSFLTGMCAWAHTGYGIDAPPAAPFRSDRLGVSVLKPDARSVVPDPNRPTIVAIGSGLSASVPQTVWFDSRTRTAPPSKGFTKPVLAALSLGERDTRLASVALAWATVGQFWPYWEDEPRDWDGALAPALRAAAEDTPASLLATLRRMLARIPDGQAGAWIESDTGERSLPIFWDWVEGNAVVVASSADTGADVAGLDDEAARAQRSALAALKPGTIIRAIGGVATDRAIAAAEAVAPAATDRFRRRRALDDLLRTRSAAPIELMVSESPGGAESRVFLRATAPPDQLHRKAPDALAEIEPGVFYIDPNRMSAERLASALDENHNARAFIVDLRGNAEISPILGRLIGDVGEPPPEWAPVMMLPDQADLGFQPIPSPIMPQTPRVRARLIFLADASTIGQPERDLLFIQQTGLGQVFGTPTAGTAGEIATVVLPAGMHVGFTGTMCRRYDGDPLLAVGVTPDVEIAPTLAGVAAGKDEVLDRALRALEDDAVKAPPAP
jgi:hypothetical protein